MLASIARQLSACRLTSVVAPIRTVKTVPAPAAAFQPFGGSLDVPVKNLQGEQVDTISLHPDVFGLPMRRDIVHRVVVWQRACRRQGSASSKSRGQVRGSTKKLYRQKGTGNARVGSARAPHRVGGGVAHGPKPRDFSYTLPKKVRKLGLCTTLSAKLSEGRLSVVEDLEIGSHKTKSLNTILEGNELTNALFVDGDLDEANSNFSVACKNVPNVQLLPSDMANVYAMLKRKDLVLTRSAVEQLQERLA
eukprot:TRINITY_DN11577_c0_g1_i5.p1 TRINITY_DN11577_c0_g1~~TRINITY_DN11577_c0_g1_i5.p1  ORF type:complete len:249 (+),score=44.52 TRINITY_DN11577_c0_g1_i5:207-953(+)